MLAEKAQNPPAQATPQESFFRQSGWLMIANVAGGALMYAVHLLNRALPQGQYGSFVAFLTVVMLVPNIPLQMLMAQQTAKGLATGRKAEVTRLFWQAWWVTNVFWLVAAAVVIVLQDRIMAGWKMTSPGGLWITMFIVLLSLWTPLFWGLLQGKQNFLWLGWSMLTNAIGRVAVAAFAVLVLHAYATGMVAGVLCGMIIAGSLGAWHSRDIWLAKSKPFDSGSLLRQIVPLFVGFLGFQMLFTADTLFVKTLFTPADVDFYGSAGTLSRALLWLVLPLASVMFPRIVHSAAKSEKTNLANIVFLGTLVLGMASAFGLIILGPWVVRLLYKGSYLSIVPKLLPWYAAAIVPLALANVLLNDLLARPASKLIPSLCVLGLALAYLLGLSEFHHDLPMVLKTMGVFNLLLLALCAWFTWGGKIVGRPPNRS